MLNEPVVSKYKWAGEVEQNNIYIQDHVVSEWRSGFDNGIIW